MAVTRRKKIALAEEYKEMLEGFQVAVLTGYQGLTVSELTALRRQLGQAGVRFHVVKNTVAKRALAEIGVSSPDEAWQGPNALGVATGDPTATAKLFTDYARGEPRLVIKGGFLGTGFLDAESVVRLADLPPREVVLAQLLAGIQAPVAGLVTVLSGVVRSLVNVLDARRRQMQEG